MKSLSGLAPAAFSLAVFAMVTSSSLAQQSSAPAVAPGAGPVADSNARAIRPSGRPERDTLKKLMRPITLSYNENRLEDVIASIKDLTEADIEPMWLDDRTPEGLDKETKITLDVKGRSAMAVLEQVLELAGRDGSNAAGNTWQMSESGAIQIGPRSRLNKFRRVEMYSIQDMLMDVPNYTNAPDFDLQSVLQSGQGGAQSPFRANNEDTGDGRTTNEKAQEVVDILTQLVETDQWVDNGGDSATMRFFQGSLIVNAPDYVHRGLVGYPYWPAASTRVSMVQGRRYVTIGTQQAISQIDGIAKDPVIIPPP